MAKKLVKVTCIDGGDSRTDAAVLSGIRKAKLKRLLKAKKANTDKPAKNSS
mgnify:CR=1 FL=1